MLQVTTAMNSAVATDGEKLNPKRHLSLPGEECAVSRVSKRQRIRNVKWIESPSVCHDKRKSDDYDHAKIWYSVSDSVELQFMMSLICFVLCVEKSQWLTRAASVYFCFSNYLRCTETRVQRFFGGSHEDN